MRRREDHRGDVGQWAHGTQRVMLPRVTGEQHSVVSRRWRETSGTANSAGVGGLEHLVEAGGRSFGHFGRRWTSTAKGKPG